MTAPNLSSLLTPALTQLSLEPRTDLVLPDWSFWELRTLNRHRVVGLHTETRPLAGAQALEAEIRSMVSRYFKTAWWRGMGFGIVVDVPAITLTPDDLKLLVDARENSQGTWQWVILVAGGAQAALGVHTWMEVYLSPVYRSLLEALAGHGYHVANARREKDGLLRFLTGEANLGTGRIQVGIRGVQFPEFREPDLG